MNNNDSEEVRTVGIWIFRDRSAARAINREPRWKGLREEVPRLTALMMQNNASIGPKIEVTTAWII